MYVTVMKLIFRIVDSNQLQTMKRWPNLIMFVSILFVGCSPVSSTNETLFLKDNLTDEISINELLGKVSYITIDAHSELPLIGMITKARLYEDYIYIADFKSIHVFTEEGLYINTITKYGRGRTEYVGITDFIVHKDFIYLLDNNKKLLKYSRNGEYIASTILDFYPASLKAINDNNLLLTSAYQSDTDKFHILDNITFERKYSFCPINTNQITWRHFKGQSNFYEYGDILFFNEPMNNEIYQIQDTTTKIIRSLDLFGRNAPKEFWNKRFNSVLDINQEANENEFCFGTPNYVENDSIIWFTYRDGENYRICHYLKKEDISKQSSNIFFSQLSTSVPVTELVFSVENEKEQMVILTGDLIDSSVKKEMLNVSEEYDNLIVVIKES